MVDNLMGQAPIVLQDVPIICPACTCNLFDHGQDLVQLIIGNVGEFCAVVLWDDELERVRDACVR